MEIQVEIKMKIIDILAQYKAIKNTAKKYHWKTTGGAGFMGDHLLFDRIYDDISDDVVDTIVEQYFMGVGRKNIDDIDSLTQLCLDYEGANFPATESGVIAMFSELAKMMNNFITNIEKIQAIRGINSELDNMASTVTQLYGLVIARIG